ncbi:MAG TPA: hypothetical protein IGS40_20075 [Trichormus sp. M33_DOE_039]|nr:hypothetical protein [Trichormus sp. M33_DOE_039]
MLTPSITPIRLLKDSLRLMLLVYINLLFFLIPYIILSLSKFAVSEIAFSLIYILYYFSLGILVIGARVFLVYKKLNYEDVTVYDSLRVTINKFPEIIFLEVINLLGIITFLLPRLYFVRYLVIIEDLTTAEAIKRCWYMTKGYGWQIFWNLLTFSFSIRTTLNILSSLITAFVFGASFWDVNRDASSINQQVFISYNLINISINFFFSYPLSTVYDMLMFIRILNADKRNLKALIS